MDNQDKIFEQIKNAALNQQATDFASIDKVWSRVESKLDNKVLKKEKKLWKKIAIAASLLLVFTVAYQVFKPAKQIAIPPTQMVVIDSAKTIIPVITNKETAVAVASEANPIIKKNAGKILEKQLTETTETVASNDAPMTQPAAETAVVAPALESVSNIAKEKDADGENRRPSSFKKAKAFEARSISRNLDVNDPNESDRNINQSAQGKSAPLMVIDGKAVTGEDAEQTLKKSLKGLDPNDVAEFSILKEPLYIINGSQYSEQELFGPNPTSPYYPLNQQEIEALSILQGEKAIAAYGKKGEKGVVIISTKYGKPVKASSRKKL